MKYITLVVLLCICVTAKADITTGLIAHWKFDNDLTEEIGGHDLAATAGAASFDNSALPFSGAGTTHNLVITSDDTNVTSTTVTGVTGAYSIAYWIKTTSVAGVVTSHTQGAGTGLIQTRVQADGTMRFANGSNFATVSAINNGVWRHVCATSDGVNSSGFTWYVDGAVDATGTGTTATVVPAGDYRVPPSTGQVAEIDDLRVYARELSPTDVTELYNYTGSSSSQLLRTLLESQ